jgi:hypothetical protein
MSLSDPVLHLRAMGVVLVALAVLHAAFPRCFRWSTELTSLSPINQALMRVHTFFVALAVGLMGMLSWPEAPALVSTPLGRRVCAGLALFWGLAVETAVHVLFTALWTWLTSVYA